MDMLRNPGRIQYRPGWLDLESTPRLIQLRTSSKSDFQFFT